MENQGLNNALYDFAFYQIHDGIKTRALPLSKEQLMPNLFVSLGYNMLTAKPLKQLQQWIPTVSQPYGDMITKFLGETVGFISYGMLMGKPVNYGAIMLKQILAQGSQEVLKQI